MFKITHSSESYILYFFDNKIRVFPFPNNPKNLDPSRKMNFAIIRVSPFLNNPKALDPSCKMDLELWDCLRRVKLVL